MLERFDGKLENALSGMGRPGVDQATATQRVPVRLTPQ